MSNGEEEGKGDELTKETFPLLKKAPINFIGNIEGRDVMEGTADVITCDGFVGNVILKTVEGMGHVVSTKVKNIFMKKLVYKDWCNVCNGRLEMSLNSLWITVNTEAHRF